MLNVSTWNESGVADKMDTGLNEYWFDLVKRKIIIEKVKTDIKKGWQKAIDAGIPYDVAAHSLGTVATYEAIRELKTERPDIAFRNVFLMGSPLAFFFDQNKAVYDANAFQNVQNVVNIYNTNDAMNNIKTEIKTGAIYGASSINPLLGGIITNFVATKPVSRELKPFFANIKDVKTDVPHGNMWIDPRMLKDVEANGVFN